MSKIIIITMTAIACCGILSSCSTTAGTNVTTDHLSGNTSMIISNSRLDHRLKVASVNYDTINGIKRVSIALQSNKNKRYNYQYRIVWFDENGIEIATDTKPYRTLILDGHDTATVTGLANNADAVKSKIRIRESSSAD